jgi:putative spermidine/putrescine transport system substrate-binding protein
MADKRGKDALWTPRSGGINRRDFLRMGGRLGAGAVLLGGSGSLLAACGDGGGAATGDAPAETTEAAGGERSGSGEIVIVTWGGAIQDAERQHVYEPFTRDTGIRHTIAGPPELARIKAMVDAGNVEWDVVIGGPGYPADLGEEYFEPIDYSYFDDETLAQIPEEYRHEYSVGFYVFSTHIGWNTDLLPQGLETWADFWDVAANPGGRTLAFGGGSNPQLEVALLADGVAMEDLYPLDVDRAFAKMEEIRPHIVQWWSSGAQPGQMLVNEEVAAGSIWIGRAITLGDEGAPVDFTFNQGSIAPADWLIPKGTPNYDEAMQLIAYSLRKEVQAAVWGSYVEGPTNLAAFEDMDEEWARMLPTHPDNIDRMFVVDEFWWAEHREEILQRFQEFVL